MIGAITHLNNGKICMIEKTILSNLIYNEEYCRRVFPYIKEEYFDDNSLRKIFSTYSDYMNEYKEPPSIEALKISIDKRKDLNESAYKEVTNLIDDLKIETEWFRIQSRVEWMCKKQYKAAIKLGIAKEQARALLPEGLTKSRLYVNGSLRSWLHYIDIRSLKLFLFSTAKIRKMIKVQFQEFFPIRLVLVSIHILATTFLKILSLGMNITTVKKNAFLLTLIF